MQIAAVALVAAAIGLGTGAGLRGSRSETPDAGTERVPPAELSPSAAAPTTPDDTPAQPTSSAAPSPSAPKATSPRRKHATTAPKTNCDPPFVRDDEGRKIYKRECLK